MLGGVYEGGYFSIVVVRMAQASLASRIDEIVGAFALGRSERSRARSRSEALDHAQRMDALAALHERHSSAHFAAPPEIFFGRAGHAGAWQTRTARRIGSTGEVIDVRWRSGYEIVAPEADVRNRYSRSSANEWAHARLWLHGDRPRPTAILVHGYRGGNFAMEERAWPMRFFFDRLGLDLALAVLPFHGARNLRGKRPLFPSSDPRLNVEAFRHAIWDLISLRRALGDRGAPAVGMMGMSLGGYTTALALTVDPQLAFGVPLIPLASIADFARDAGRLVGTPSERLVQHAALEEAHRPVSPFTRTTHLLPRQMRVIAGQADRITPTSHAERLATHLQAPLSLFHGGHLLQFGRGEGFREVARMLRDLELLTPRGRR